METDDKAGGEKQRQTLGGLYKEFGETTTMHGLGRAVGSRQIWKRIIWALLVMGGAGWGLYQLHKIVKEFRTYPVLTVVTREVHNTLVFPKVTICNRNILRWSQLSEEDRQVLNRSFTSNEGTISRESIESVLTSHNFDWTNKTKEAPIGHSLEDMFLRCEFNLGKQSCSEVIRYDFFNEKLGNCFTFAKGYTWTIAWPGPRYGLTLEIDVQQYDYLPWTSHAGISVMINAADVDTESDDSQRYLISPGSSTSIALREVTTQRLPSPYGDCISNNLTSHTILRTMMGNNFNAWKCSLICHQVSVYKECQCCDASAPCDATGIKTLAGEAVISNASITMCNVSSECLMDVIYDNSDSKSEECEKLCPPRCDETIYEGVTSSAAWPAEEYLSHYASILETENPNRFANLSGNSTEELRTFMGKNYLRLEVFLDSSQYTKIKTVPAYDWNKVVADIGGNLGLWLGFSLLTAVEIVELILDSVLFLIKKVFKRNTAVKDVKMAAWNDTT